MQEITEVAFYEKIASYIEVQSQFSSALAGAGGAMLLSGLELDFIQISPWPLHQIFALNACKTPTVNRTVDTPEHWRRNNMIRF